MCIWPPLRHQRDKGDAFHNSVFVFLKKKFSKISCKEILSISKAKIERVRAIVQKQQISLT